MRANLTSRALSVAVVVLMVAASFAVMSTVLSSPAAPAASTAATPTAPATSPAPAASSTPVLAQDASQHAALEAKVGAVMSGALAAGVQPSLLHLPNLNPTPQIPGEAIAPGYTHSPTPMGVSYYGESGTGSTVTVVDSSSVQGQISFNSLSTFYMDSTSPDQMGAQINALANNATLQGGSKYDYWAQNVIAYYTHSDNIQFVQNTWNFSSTAEAFPSSGQSSVVANSSGMQLYEGIYLGTGPTFYAPPPFSLNLYLNSSVVGSTYTLYPHTANQAIVRAGDQELWYNYTLHDSVTGMTYTGNYNWLIFNSTNPTHPWTTNGPGGLPFEASGSKANAATNLDADYEMDIGLGAFDGATQDVFNISGTATESYVNDCSGRTASTPATCALTTGPGSGTSFTTVPAAYNIGSQTGETSLGVTVGYTGTTAVFSTGPSIIHGLWGYTSAGDVATTATITNNVQVSGDPLGTLATQPYTFFFMESTNFSSQGYTWVPDVSSWTLMSGVYNWEAMLSDYQEQTGTIAILTTGKVLTATMPYATTSGVYTPLWALNNGQLAGISSSGAGTVTSQYKLFNNPTSSCTLCGSAANANLSANFAMPNDYYFPSFTGIQLMNTNAYVDVNNPASTAVWTVNSPQTPAAHDFLQLEFYNTSHVTLSNGSLIRGMSMPAIGIALASQNVIPQGAVMFWNSTNDLIYQNNFVAQRALACASSSSLPCSPNEGLLLYNPTYVTANNVVWGNTFRNPPGVALGTTYAGMSVSSNGNTIYNNYFDVDNPVVAMIFEIYGVDTFNTPCYSNLAGYCILWPYSNTWSIANESASVSTTVNGVYTLTGSISGSAYQGGNLYWNYGNSLNAFTAIPYVDTFAYTDLVSDGYFQTANSPSIVGTGDQTPLLPGIGANPGYLYTSTFTQTGLGPGVSWTVTVAGTTSPGTTSPAWTATTTVTRTQTGPSAAPIVLPQGTYTVTVTGPSGTNPSWNATGAPPSLTSSSSAPYPLTFQLRWATTASKATATGLPSGTRWFANYTGPITGSVSGTGNTLSFSLPNGTFSYTVQANGYAATPSQGFFIVSAATSSPITVTHFTHIVFQATFSVAGLPASTNWKVWVNGSYHSAIAPAGAIAIGLQNGTYNFTVFSIAGYGATPRVGNVIVAGANPTVSLVFSSFTYTVTFSAPTLPGGASWAVTLNGVLSSSAATTITFPEPNGTYSYAVAIFGSTPYTITPSSGSVTVNHAAVSTTIVFSAPAIYALYFTENGLAPGTTWTVTVTGIGTSTPTSNPTISFTGLTAGTYVYTVNAVTGYGAPSPSGGSPVITTASISTAISFSLTTYTVTFTESGLTLGTWAVTFGGTIYWSSTTTITIQVAPGTYAWYIGYEAGKTPSQSSGSTTINPGGPGAGYTITFT